MFPAPLALKKNGSSSRGSRKKGSSRGSRRRESPSRVSKRDSSRTSQQHKPPSSVSKQSVSSSGVSERRGILSGASRRHESPADLDRRSRPLADGAPGLQELEQKLGDVLQSLSPTGHTDTALLPMSVPAGGTADRIENLMKLADQMSAAVTTFRSSRSGAVEALSAASGSTHLPLRSSTDSTAPERSNQSQVTSPTTSRSAKSKSRQKRYIPLDLGTPESIDFPRFLKLDFGSAGKADVNPYLVLDCIRNTGGTSVKAVTGYNKSSYTIEVNNKQAATSLLALSEVAARPCSFSIHPRFNICRGIMYIYEFDISDIAEFKQELQSRYNISDVEPASFIKAKSSNARPFLVTFNQSDLPYSIYIPGERQDTRIYKFHNRPMLCRGCQQYGHTQKRCQKSDVVCGRCSATGHDHRSCAAEVLKCLHCGAAHAVGSVDCPRHQREQLLVDTQDREKVTFMRAKQILENNNEFVEQPVTTFPTHYDCVLPANEKRKFSPWLLEKCLTSHLGAKPKTVRSLNATTFLVEVQTTRESDAMASLRSLNQIDVRVSVNSSVDLIKGLIYIHGYNMSDFPAFKAGLMAQYGLHDVVEASWIKPRSQNSAKPLLLSFRGTVPTFLEIPGEMMKTRVYAYKKRPLLCRNCLDYGHTKTNCTRTVRCKQCGHVGHEQTACTQQAPSCLHCTRAHETGDRQCRYYKYEEEILALQAASHVSRLQAKFIFDRDNPDFLTRSYSEAVRRPTDSAVALRSEEPTAGSSHPKPQTEVVCVSPTGGRLFTTTVDISRKRSGGRDLDGDSECNPVLRAEARMEFDAFVEPGTV